MNNLIPTLKTERLILTGHTLHDFPDMLRLWQDPVATRYVPPGVLSEEACWAIWLQYRGSWAGLGFGYWAIKEKASGAFIGEIGFLDLRRETTPSLPAMPEVGTILHSRYHGYGYGYEAKCAILQWQEKHFPGPVCCLVLPENQVSLKQARKVGFTFDEQVEYQGLQLYLGVRDRSQQVS